MMSSRANSFRLVISNDQGYLLIVVLNITHFCYINTSILLIKFIRNHNRATSFPGLFIRDSDGAFSMFGNFLNNLRKSSKRGRESSENRRKLRYEDGYVHNVRLVKNFLYTRNG